MSRLVQRLLRRTLWQTTGLVCLVFVGLQAALLFMRELDDLGRQQYDLSHALLYVLLVLPQTLYALMPMIGLLGCVLGLGGLAAEQALLVLRAAGLSLPGLMWALSGAVVGLIVVAVCIGEGAGPPLHHWADTIKARALSGGDVLHTAQGTWLHPGPNRFVHINSVTTQGRLRGITAYHVTASGELRTIEFAQAGHRAGAAWAMHAIQSSTWTPQRVHTQQHAQQHWPIQIAPRVLRLLKKDPEYLSLRQLYQALNSPEGLGAPNAKLALAFWQRLLQPWVMALLLCIALPFLWGNTRQMTMGLRGFIGVMIGVCFFLLNAFIGPFALLYHVPPWLAAAAPTLILVGVAGLGHYLRVQSQFGVFRALL